MCQAPELRIRTPRLTLRTPVMADAVYIAELANDAEVARMTTGVKHPYRLADAEHYLLRLQAMGSDKACALLIEDPRFGPAGMVGVYRKDDPCPELGFWVGRLFRGRGLATEALQGLLGWVTGGWGCRGVIAGHFVDNPASGRVLEKADFLYTGEVRPRFSLGRGQEVATRMMVWLA